MNDYHEHPHFNGQYHTAVWARVWVSGDTNDIEPPDGIPVTCAICGIPRDSPQVKE